MFDSEFRKPDLASNIEVACISLDKIHMASVETNLEVINQGVTASPVSVLHTYENGVKMGEVIVPALEAGESYSYATTSTGAACGRRDAAAEVDSSAVFDVSRTTRTEIANDVLSE